MTVRDLLARTDSRELAEWMAYEQVEGPLGGARGDFQAALIAAQVAAASRSSNDPPVKVADFLPEWGQAQGQGQSSDEQYEIVRQLNRAFGGTEG